VEVEGHGANAARFEDEARGVDRETSPTTEAALEAVGPRRGARIPARALAG
jgi:hypothetical protein